jgi:hypothetical protein
MCRYTFINQKQDQTIVSVKVSSKGNDGDDDGDDEHESASKKPRSFAFDHEKVNHRTDCTCVLIRTLLSRQGVHIHHHREFHFDVSGKRHLHRGLVPVQFHPVVHSHDGQSGTHPARCGNSRAEQPMERGQTTHTVRRGNPRIGRRWTMGARGSRRSTAADHQRRRLQIATGASRRDIEAHESSA